MNDMQNIIERLSVLIDIIPETIETRDEYDFALQPWLGIWSKKQILGYLIDCAVMTHQRIVRKQYEKKPVIFYNRKQSVNLQNYNGCDTIELIQFWKLYNKHLLHIIKTITSRKVMTASAEGKYHLKSLISDYVDHVEHEVKKIVEEHNFLVN